MISNQCQQYCREDISLIENYEIARNDKTQVWVCHHKNEIIENKSVSDLKNEGRYYDLPASDLIFLTMGEHHLLHNPIHNPIKQISEQPSNNNNRPKDVDISNVIFQSRLNDFRNILTFHTVMCIIKYFNYDYNEFYDVYYKMKRMENISSDYMKEMTERFRKVSLHHNKTRAIFGKRVKSLGQFIPYSKLIESDTSIDILNHGVKAYKESKTGFNNCYILQYDYIKSIFDNLELLSKVVNYHSDFYTRRQSKLIKNQIINKW